MKIYRYAERCNVSGERIRAERERVQRSQEQLAAKIQLEGLNINQKAISRIETGKRVVADYELMTFARVLGVTVDCLLSDT